MIEIENISKNLGEFFLRDISFDIKDGEYFMILGPTGAGKTILLETIAGIYRPDKGRILMAGKDITYVPPKDRNISMVYQDYMLFPHLNVEQNVAFGLRLKKTPKEIIKDKVEKSSKLLNIYHLLHRYPGTLSGGEKQRVAIARAMVIEPYALLLDEPLSALDMQTRDRLRQELKRIHSITKTTIVHVTHNFEEVFSLADRVAVMNEGRIIQVGRPEEIFRKPNSEFVANFVGVENLFRGKSIVENGSAHINVDGVDIFSTGKKSGEVFVSVRPEEILISKQPFKSSARNSLKGKIVRIVNSGATAKVTVDTGIPFKIMITRQSLENMQLKEGETAYITFKASAVHIF
ncbi:MAG: ABC transporter [Candidatus Cloacimonas sp. 4484_209]|nr:MAG: ABC transporter [Candidatus Cloacimonas sp. 4484_209]